MISALSKTGDLVRSTGLCLIRVIKLHSYCDFYVINLQINMSNYNFDVDRICTFKKLKKQYFNQDVSSVCVCVCVVSLLTSTSVTTSNSGLCSQRHFQSTGQCLPLWILKPVFVWFPECKKQTQRRNSKLWKAKTLKVMWHAQMKICAGLVLAN